MALRFGNKKDLMIAGRYRIVRKIGSGSFGDIYLGINITNGEVMQFDFKAFYSVIILCSYEKCSRDRISNRWKVLCICSKRSAQKYHRWLWNCVSVGGHILSIPRYFFCASRPIIFQSGCSLYWMKMQKNISESPVPFVIESFVTPFMCII